MAKDTKKQKEWKPKKVDGKIQRARTYAPGWDVICVRAPASMIDKIRSTAKAAKKSISNTVCEKFGFKFGGEKESKPKAAKKAAPKKAPKAKAKEANHAPATELTEGAHATELAF